MKTTLAALGLVLAGLGAQHAFAQVAVVPDPANVAVSPAVVTPYGYSTPYTYSNYNPRLRGRGDAYRGLGEYNLYTSNAYINYEEARSRWMDNKLKYAMMYWERKRIAREHLAAEAAERIATRDRWLKNRVPDIPARLTSAQLNPYDGKITWPRELMGAEFAVWRQRLNDLFAVPSNERDTLHQYEVKEAVDVMKEILREEMLAMPSNQYLATRKFLESLSWERQFTDPSPVATTQQVPAVQTADNSDL
ncbi:MAG: hypothetical protein IT428_33150 [Planctomycetaceae bacterium]|nr:hypothetical protein [Planctomycetaceae bacterium]